MAITEEQISTRAYSDSDEPSIRRAAEEQYYGKFSEFSKADIQIIMLGERIVGWFYCFVPDNSIYHGQIFIFVFPEYRRKGIGALVYHRAVNRTDGFDAPLLQRSSLDAGAAPHHQRANCLPFQRIG